MMRKPPFYGRGLAWPVRVDESTGSTVVTEGKTDDPTVNIGYINDRWTADRVPESNNHVSEAIINILMTRKGEHDTLPAYGSDLFNVLFEPNSEEFRMLASFYFTNSTERWEKRAVIPKIGGVNWRPSGDQSDRGELPVALLAQFLLTQDPANLVAPFVEPRLARAAEYPLGQIDDNSHDGTSRYWGADTYNSSGTKYIRLRKSKPIVNAPDDQFVEVVHGDTWLLISYKVYGDIRHWSTIVDYYNFDAAKGGGSRDLMDNTPDPAQGTILRVPSRKRLLLELAA